MMSLKKLIKKIQIRSYRKDKNYISDINIPGDLAVDIIYANNYMKYPLNSISYLSSVYTLYTFNANDDNLNNQMDQLLHILSFRSGFKYIKETKNNQTYLVIKGSITDYDILISYLKFERNFDIFDINYKSDITLENNIFIIKTVDVLKTLPHYGFKYCINNGIIEKQEFAFDNNYTDNPNNISDTLAMMSNKSDYLMDIIEYATIHKNDIIKEIFSINQMTSIMDAFIVVKEDSDDLSICKELCRKYQYTESSATDYKIIKMPMNELSQFIEDNINKERIRSIRNMIDRISEDRVKKFKICGHNIFYDGISLFQTIPLLYETSDDEYNYDTNSNSFYEGIDEVID